MDRIPVTVNSLTNIAEDVRLLSLQAVGENKLPAVEPGAHIDLFLRDGLVRQYSLINEPVFNTGEVEQYQLAVKREAESRGGSAYIHNELAEGDRLDISKPRNNFVLEPGSGPVYLFAGGIGITPILSMVRALKYTERRFHIAYFVRDEKHAIFADELRAFKGACQIYAGQKPEETKESVQRILEQAPEQAHIYVCGPEAFMDCVLECGKRQRFPPSALHMESFTPSSVQEDGEEFEVQLAKSNLNVVVGSDESILDALAREGIEVDFSCEQGICGACLTTVLDGVPQHEDKFLTDEEKAKGDQMCLCVSRSAQGILVLDL